MFSGSHIDNGQGECSVDNGVRCMQQSGNKRHTVPCYFWCSGSGEQGVLPCRLSLYAGLSCVVAVAVCIVLPPAAGEAEPGRIETHLVPGTGEVQLRRQETGYLSLSCLPFFLTWCV